MLNIQQLRQNEPKIVIIGNYPLVQSILDFDYLSGKVRPGVIAIIASGRRQQKYFWGKGQILIPVFPSLAELPNELKDTTTLFLNLTSSRRVRSSSEEALNQLPHAFGGVIFAENVPEQHALELYNLTQQTNKWLIGPASAGILIPAHLKLGAVGGLDPQQFINSRLLQAGDTAVLSASGGMTGELMNIVAKANQQVSFALSFGGDRFPIVSPRDAFLAAEQDPLTKTIVYYGELGGYDEYEIIELIQNKQLTKRVICYIGGSVADLFPQSPQFGHAKAMAQKDLEKAVSKREALNKAGVQVGNTFQEFVELISTLNHEKIQSSVIPEQSENKDDTHGQTMVDELQSRKEPLITSSISSDRDGEPTLLGTPLLAFAQDHSFSHIVGSLFLGKPLQAKDTENFIDFVLRLAVDHGPYVSGAVNTIITARAGRDLVSALASGLLTIGPRFGGATNEAAGNWLTGATSNQSADSFVESYAKIGKRIAGIGHRKYRIDQPDPRVQALLSYSKELASKRFTEFALEVEKITTAKKGNLILNVDGAIACVLLDMLSEKEQLSDDQLRQLVTTEFFNALFVLSRSVGLIAHFLDQKRLDEGLFRLPEELVGTIEKI